MFLPIFYFSLVYRIELAATIQLVAFVLQNMSPGCPGEGLLIHFRSKCDIAFSSFLWRGDLSVTSWRPCGDNHFYLKNEKNIAFSSLLTSRCQFFGLVLLTTRPSQCTYKLEILSIYKLALSPFYRIYLARRHSRVEFLKNFLSLSKMSRLPCFWPQIRRYIFFGKNYLKKKNSIFFL